MKRVYLVMSMVACLAVASRGYAYEQWRCVGHWHCDYLRSDSAQGRGETSSKATEAARQTCSEIGADHGDSSPYFYDCSVLGQQDSWTAYCRCQYTEKNLHTEEDTAGTRDEAYALVINRSAGNRNSCYSSGGNFQYDAPVCQRESY